MEPDHLLFLSLKPLISTIKGKNQTNKQNKGRCWVLKVHVCCFVPGQLVIKSAEQLEIEPVGGIVCGKEDCKFCGAQRHHRLKIVCAPPTQIGT